MLSPKPWKFEAIVRLFLSLFACLGAGSLVGSILYSQTPAGPGRWKFVVLATAAFCALAAALVLLRKPWTRDNFLKGAGSALALFYFGIVLTVWAQSLARPLPIEVSLGQMIVAMLAFHGAALVLVGDFLRRQQMAWAEAFGFTNKIWWAILLGVAVAWIFLPVGGGLQWLIVSAVKHWQNLRINMDEQQAVQTLRHADSLLERWVAGAFTIVIAPTGEETLFRGIMYPALKQAGFPKLALVVTSLAFAAMHQNAVAFLPLLVLAIILTILYEKTNNLLAPIVAHATFNGLELASLYHLQGALHG